MINDLKYLHTAPDMTLEIIHTFGCLREEQI